MDLQQLENFLIVAQEENITHAANFLHISQPALSRQIQALEAELGTQLIIRGKRKIQLTKDGLLLRKRAREITDLIKKTTNELSLQEDSLNDDIYVAVSETDAIRQVAQAVQQLRQKHPHLNLKLRNGNNEAVYEMVNNGLVDMGIYFGNVNQKIYHTLKLKHEDQFGALMPKDHPLATKKVISLNDLQHQPLIVHQGSLNTGQIQTWLGQSQDELPIVATFDMYIAAKKMVEAGLAIGIVFENLVRYPVDDLVMRPIVPPLTTQAQLIWKKYQVFSDSAQALLDTLTQAHS